MPNEWIDDQSISDSEILWRRILPRYIKSDPSTGKPVPSSAAIRTKEMSVHISSLTTVEKALADYPDCSLISFSAGVVRSQGCIIIRDPIKDDPSQRDDPSHALVCKKSLNKAQARNIIDQSTWEVLR